MEPLIESSALEGFPGAPFPPAMVAAGSEAVRTIAGWHIAPEITQTVEIDTRDGGKVAMLRSLHIKQVDSVTDTHMEPLEGWTVNRTTGALYRPSGWPREGILVTFTHGFEKCPADLVPVIAEHTSRFRAGMIDSESIGARSVKYRTEAYSVLDDILSRYSLSWRP